MTKSILKQCNIIRPKHPNSKKLVVKNKLSDDEYSKLIGKVKRVQLKRLRNDSLRKTVDTHQDSLQQAL